VSTGSEISQIKVGDVLNGIYRVERFLARGGMGEVFVGSNIQTEEKVALKVILPALSADAKIQAMFLKEAKTLTKLSHPALVQYRVLAEEPSLKVLYIATDYIEGKSLSEVITGYGPTLSEITALTRRLADGLRTAHELGAIHRDLSPDNILLERGRLERARIIDFGIAKDLDPGSATIIGDGFAGKLGFVAPEQMGDFNREVGPWTDVYSLGLVILSVARGRMVDMGKTLVEAIDKRRAPPDLSDVPAEIRPLLQAMLVADPKVRLRSMDEVIEVLDRGNYQRTMIASPITMLDLLGESGGSAPPPPPPMAPPPPPAAAAPPPPPPAAAAAPYVAPTAPAYSAGGSGGGKSKVPLIAGGAAAAVALAAGAYFFMSGPSSTGNPQMDAQAVASRADCTWVTVTSEAGGGKLVLTGASGDVAGLAKDVSEIAGGQSVDTGGVAPVESTACKLLDTLKPLRGGGVAIAPSQSRYELRNGGDPTKSGPSALAEVNVDIGTGSNRFVLYDLTQAGMIRERVMASDDMAEYIRAGVAEKVSDDRFRLKPGIDETGWRGLLLLTSASALPSESTDALKGTPTESALQTFANDAAGSGWKVDLAWVNFVDNDPD
jgi:eukaryotic-like serine/threonine-protein kinase